MLTGMLCPTPPSPLVQQQHQVGRAAAVLTPALIPDPEGGAGVRVLQRPTLAEACGDRLRPTRPRGGDNKGSSNTRSWGDRLPPQLTGRSPHWETSQRWQQANSQPAQVWHSQLRPLARFQEGLTLHD